jgi:2,4-dienoyl-CoA reductase-like NADH-dependent reductase (Old Yellow Enzyme family)
MNKKGVISTRREFLKMGTCAAVTVLTRVPCLAQTSNRSLDDEYKQTERRDNYKVFSEGRIANLRLKNRLVKAATVEGAAQECEFSDLGVAFYKALSEGGVGLIISGMMAVMREDIPFSTMTCIYEDRLISSIQKIADAVHQAQNGCKVIAQIGHGGMQTPAEHPVAPSAIAWPRIEKTLHVLSTNEVENIITHFVRAAMRAREAGFDGVEIHCAHGYLLSSFLSPILIKMNCDDMVEEGIDINSFPALANEVAKTGVDAIEVSGNSPAREELDDLEKQSYFRKYIEKLDMNIPVILTGGNKSIELIEEIAQKGNADFFGFARPLIREHDLPNRWLEGIGGVVSTCISCNGCLSSMWEGPLTRCSFEQ